MNAGTLQEILSIWRLVDSDRSTKYIRLAGPKLEARVEGMHCGVARRTRHKVDLAESPVSVDGASLLGLLDLFESGQEVELGTKGTSLTLVGGERRAVLRLLRDSSGFAKVQKRTGVEAHAPTMRQAVAFLQGCISTGAGRPILTGILFSSAGNGKTLLAATDGERRYGFAKVTLALPAGDWIVPAGDLGRAIQILGEPFTIDFSDGSLYLQDKNTQMKIALLGGEFPDRTALPKTKHYKRMISIAPQVIAAAAKASAILDPDRYVKLAIKNNRVRLIVKGQETGGFAITAGEHEIEDIEIVFDAMWLDATKALGETVTMRYRDRSSPVLFVGDESRYRLWMSPILR